jgi:hypothetical protein
LGIRLPYSSIGKGSYLLCGGFETLGINEGADPVGFGAGAALFGRFPSFYGLGAGIGIFVRFIAEFGRI